MNKRDVYNAGKQRGFCIASWQDLPEIGMKTDRSIDFIGIDSIETVSDAKDYFFRLCDESESLDRQFSPFEFTAKELNDSHDPEGLWAEFERGIAQGFLQNWNQRKGYYDGI